MRDFRDAKAMAHSVRAALATKGLKITISQSLELIAEAFGAADWNTLAAAIRGATGPQAPAPTPPAFEPVSSGGRVGFSTELTGTLHRAIGLAEQRKHEYATVEHLMLALADDLDALDVMKACGGDPAKLKASLGSFLDNELSPQTVDEPNGAKPNAGFQRVIQRAVLHVQASGRNTVTGAQLLVGIFSEAESCAAQLLAQQAMTRDDAVNFMIRSATNRDGGASA